MFPRPARKQVAAVIPGPVRGGVKEGDSYNIWYHKVPGKRKEHREQQEKSTTRCDIQQDAGSTRAKVGSPFCIHFARGKCKLGADCSYLHRLPFLEDDALMKKNFTHDCFGRDRFEVDREDMSGPGSFTTENKTLYATNFRPHSKEVLEQLFRQNFEEWGEIEYLKAFPEKNVTFIRYKLRSCAEFAKEAMIGQSLSKDDTSSAKHSIPQSDEALVIKWAHEDPNPGVQAARKQATQNRAHDEIQKRAKTLPTTDHNALIFQTTGGYPNTDHQYNTTNTTHYNNYTANIPQYNTQTSYNTQGDFLSPCTSIQYPQPQIHVPPKQHSTQIQTNPRQQVTGSKTSMSLLSLAQYGDDDESDNDSSNSKANTNTNNTS